MTHPLRLTIVAAVIAGAALLTFSPLGRGQAQRLALLAPSAGEKGLVAHRALYDLSMASSESGSGVVGIRGTMYYEQDNTCDAWTTDQRFNMEYQYPERRPVNTTSRYVAWESTDGNHFEFTSDRSENGAAVEQLRGSAQRASVGVSKAVYSRPGDLSFDLPDGFYLPMTHTEELIRRARAGEKFFDATLFDGTDAEGPVEISTVIGKKLTPAEIDVLAAAATGKVERALLTPDAWHVRMAAFLLKDNEESTPLYEMDMILHDNGVVSQAIVDYHLFQVMQKLKAVEALPARTCP